MKTILASLLNAWAHVRLRRASVSLVIGTGGRHYLWRVNSGKASSVEIGDDTVLLTRVVVEKSGARLRLGDRTFVGAGLISVAENVEIGNDVLVSWGVSITDHNSHSIQYSKRANDVADWTRGEKVWSDIIVSPVRIGDKSWIGFEAKILKGVTIGEGAIIGAGSVVTKDVPAWTVVAGNPARVIREIPENER